MPHLSPEDTVSISPADAYDASKTPASLEEWEAFLNAIDIHHIELGLERVSRVYRALGLDKARERACVVTVGGTNGKGSTASFVALSARLSGYSAGLYTSPHLERFTERVNVNGAEAAAEDFCAALSAVHTCALELKTELTYFEYTTLAALWIFARHQLALWVLEVGLGGRLDAVNVIYADVAVVVSVGFDHMQFLGHTLSAIASEKAGIIHSGSVAVTGDLEEEALSVIRRRLEESGAHPWFNPRSTQLVFKEQGGILSPRNMPAAPVSSQDSDSLGYALAHGGFSFERSALPGAALHCALNTLLAISTCQNFSFKVAAVRRALVEAALPCRMERFTCEGRWIILDGAHNVPAMRNLRATLDAEGVLQESSEVSFVIGMLKDKDIEGVLSQIALAGASYYLTSLQGSRGAPADRLCSALLACGVPKSAIQSYNEVEAAFNGALCARSRYLVGCGSFVTASAIRRLLLRKGCTSSKGGTEPK